MCKAKKAGAQLLGYKRAPGPGDVMVAKQKAGVL
jgi:hypothetical protein